MVLLSVVLMSVLTVPPTTSSFEASDTTAVPTAPSISSPKAKISAEGGFTLCCA
jgi:hypothetical protein